MPKGKDDLYAELKAAAKRANQRLVRLEHNNELTPAYKITVNDIQNVLGKSAGKPRFKYNKSMSFNEMEQQLKYVNKFNNSVSSTVTGMRTVIKKRNATIYKKYGTKNTTDLYRVLNSDEYKKAKELLPSSMIVQAVSDALNRGVHPDNAIDALKQLLEGENDEYLVDTMNDLLEDLDVGNNSAFDDDNEYDDEDDLPY